MKIQECASQILLYFEWAELIRRVDQRINQKGMKVEGKQNNLTFRRNCISQSNIMKNKTE